MIKGFVWHFRNILPPILFTTNSLLSLKSFHEYMYNRVIAYIRRLQITLPTLTRDFFKDTFIFFIFKDTFKLSFENLRVLWKYLRKDDKGRVEVEPWASGPHPCFN